MFHIFVDTSSGKEKRGKASNLDELLKLLKPQEIRSIFAHDAYIGMKQVFQQAKEALGEEDSTHDISGITVDFISNGYEITTLVFYFNGFNDK